MHGKMNPEFPKAHILALHALLEKLGKGMRYWFFISSRLDSPSLLLHLNFSMVCFRRCHLRASLERSSCSIAIRPALPTSISLFFFGRPIHLPPEVAIFHISGAICQQLIELIIITFNVYKSFV